ncbi:hypothetical protein LXL04_031341 [Taraxacum kok-saghyz]
MPPYLIKAPCLFSRSPFDYIPSGGSYLASEDYPDVKLREQTAVHVEEILSFSDVDSNVVMTNFLSIKVPSSGKGFIDLSSHPNGEHYLSSEFYPVFVFQVVPLSGHEGDDRDKGSNFDDRDGKSGSSETNKDHYCNLVFMVNGEFVKN